MAVADECSAMASIFSLSEKERQRLYIAALLHDITKEKNPDEQIELCRVYRIEYTETDRLTPALFHAKTGAEHAKTLFPGLCDEDTAELIRTHTTGCKDMSLLQKLLLLADGIEATRTHKTLVELRDYFYSRPNDIDLKLHLDMTVIKYLDTTMKFLIESGQAIDIQTVTARNSLILKRGNYGQ